MNHFLAVALLFSNSFATEIDNIHTNPTSSTEYTLIDHQNFNHCLVEKIPETPETNAAILKLLSHINHANRIINDMCEMMEEKVSIWGNSDKPNCRYNASFIVNNTVNLFDISENVREFLLKRKQETCKKTEHDCGELTIMLKLVDLVNSIVHISLQVDTLNELFANVEGISFYELFQTYTETLENHELLANITLKKERSNLILERERLRVKRLNTMTSTESFMEYTQIYVGTPVKSGLVYVGNTIGSTIGSLFGSALSETGEAMSMSSENKLIAIGLIAVVLLRR